jgi:6-phospho-3-hexuloisomerase
VSPSRGAIDAVVGEVQSCLAAVSAASLTAAVDALDAAPRVFVAGAGRSGLAMKALAMRLMHLGKDAHVVGDVTTPSIRPGDLLVVGSGSGATGGLRLQAARAKEVGARLLLFTIVPTSPIGVIADVVVVVPAPSPKAPGATGVVASRQPRGSLFEQALFLLGDAAVLALMDLRGTTSDRMFDRHANLE